MPKNICLSSIMVIALIVVCSVFSHGQTNTPVTPATQPAVTGPSAEVIRDGTETIVFLRHGEKPRHGLGQLTPQGLNRSLALATLLPKKFGKPDYIFAPDPIQKVDGNPGYFYVRPLATIEPTAIALEMPVQTPFGQKEIAKLNEELTKPKYGQSTIFVAWEHGMEDVAVKNLVKQFGGDAATVPAWAGNDYDSLFVIKIERKNGRAEITFTHDHEGLDNLSTAMPVPAGGTDKAHG
jgi:hypothetical protein